MEFFNLIFRLGVVLAIFSFIWGFIKIGLTILRCGMPLSAPMNIGIKTLQYLLLAEVTILFCTSDNGDYLAEAVTTGLILLMYFIGKMQNQRLKFMMVQFQGQGLNVPNKPNMKAELGVIILAMALFTFLVVNPVFADNQISNWFFTSIKDIETTPVFGFIFGIVGFFFSLSIIFRMVNSISMILSGKAFEKQASEETNEQSDKFDDFEEIN
ncbi:MAG: hypothetical protein ACEQR5_00315 [Moraxellaceae bacterium]